MEAFALSRLMIRSCRYQTFHQALAEVMSHIPQNGPDPANTLAQPRTVVKRPVLPIFINGLEGTHYMLIHHQYLPRWGPFGERGKGIDFCRFFTKFANGVSTRPTHPPWGAYRVPPWHDSKRCTAFAAADRYAKPGSGYGTRAMARPSRADRPAPGCSRSPARFAVRPHP